MNKLMSHNLILNLLKFYLLTLVLVALSSCGWSVGDSNTEAEDTSPQQTCSGESPSNNAKPYSIVFKFRGPQNRGCVLASGYGYGVEPVFANSLDEAKSCALKNIGDPGGDRYEAIEEKNLRIFVILSKSGEFTCTEHYPVYSFSSQDAISCLKSTYCSNCSYLDITDQVVTPRGIEVALIEQIKKAWCQKP